MGLIDKKAPCFGGEAMDIVSASHANSASALSLEAAGQFLSGSIVSDTKVAIETSKKAVQEGHLSVKASNEAGMIRRSACATCLAQNPELMQQVLDGTIDAPERCAAAENIMGIIPDTVREELYAEAGLIPVAAEQNVPTAV